MGLKCGLPKNMPLSISHPYHWLTADKPDTLHKFVSQQLWPCATQTYMYHIGCIKIVTKHWVVYHELWPCGTQTDSLGGIKLVTEQWVVYHELWPCATQTYRVGDLWVVADQTRVALQVVPTEVHQALQHAAQKTGEIIIYTFNRVYCHTQKILSYSTEV